MARRRLGRSKPWTNISGGAGNSRDAMSPRVAASAVAVKATVWSAAERGAQRREVHVFGTEVVAPLRDAMGLVDREQADFARA